MPFTTNVENADAAKLHLPEGVSQSTILACTQNATLFGP
jgi:hypothetical protein